METKTLSAQALSIIDRYLRLEIGQAVCSIPYFNNKIRRSRAALKAKIGKGNPDDIIEEAQSVLIKSHIDPALLSNESLKKILIDHNIGVDCSAFVYHILDAESDALGLGPLDSRIEFINCTGILGKMRCSLRPVENCDVATLADDANGTAVPLSEVRPGDIITMLGGPEGDERDHVLVIHSVEYDSGKPINIHYSHAAAYPQDGVYGTGTKQGVIRISYLDRPITSQLWIESGTEGSSNPIFIRASRSQTGLRRLKQA